MTSITHVAPVASPPCSVGRWVEARSEGVSTADACSLLRGRIASCDVLLTLE